MAKSPLKFIGALSAIGAVANLGMGIYDRVQQKKAMKAEEEKLKKQEELAGMVSANQASMEQYAPENDLAAQSLSSPATMRKLSAVGMSYTPLKMKAKEADRAATMMKVSGASDMPERSSLTYKKY
tara:strand:+ start:1212 stop:1589 length:378 start_codon:yes stop_codon:yes gene_type:complete